MNITTQTKQIIIKQLKKMNNKPQKKTINEQNTPKKMF